MPARSPTMLGTSVTGLLKTIMRLLCGLVLLLTFSFAVFGQAKNPCADFDQTIKTTYNFRPSLLASDSARDKRSASMDKVWEAVKANKDALLPCLRQNLEAANADRWFLFDGSNLLVTLDPSEASKKLQIKNYALANLEDVDLRVWVTTLVRRGLEGFDVSAPGERWLSRPNARYYLPEHGAFEVNVVAGALFIFGSMEEALATPALIRVVNQPNHPGRQVALAILLAQNTPESLRFLKELNDSSFTAKTLKIVREGLSRPDLFEPRAKPKTNRKEFIDAFEAFANGNPRLFFELIDVPDGERDVVATMTVQDLPLIRKVRRRMIAGGNQHSIEFYNSFTKIIRTILHRNESKP